MLVAVFAAADAGGSLQGGALLAHRISASLTAGTVLLVLALLVALAVRPRQAARDAAQVPIEATGVAVPEGKTALVKG